MSRYYFKAAVETTSIIKLRIKIIIFFCQNYCTDTRKKTIILSFNFLFLLLVQVIRRASLKSNTLGQKFTVIREPDCFAHLVDPEKLSRGFIVFIMPVFDGATWH